MTTVPPISPPAQGSDLPGLSDQIMNNFDQLKAMRAVSAAGLGSVEYECEIEGKSGTKRAKLTCDEHRALIGVQNTLLVSNHILQMQREVEKLEEELKEAQRLNLLERGGSQGPHESSSSDEDEEMAEKE